LFENDATKSNHDKSLLRLVKVNLSPKIIKQVKTEQIDLKSELSHTGYCI